MTDVHDRLDEIEQRIEALEYDHDPFGRDPVDARDLQSRIEEIESTLLDADISTYAMHGRRSQWEQRRTEAQSAQVGSYAGLLFCAAVLLVTTYLVWTRGGVLVVLAAALLPLTCSGAYALWRSVPPKAPRKR